MARQAFQKTVSIVRRSDAGEAWRQIRYVVFDDPHAGLPFAERLSRVKKYFAKYPHPYAMALPHFECRGREHLRQLMDQLVAQGEAISRCRSSGNWLRTWSWPASRRDRRTQVPLGVWR
jgi:DNA ligase-1